MVILADDKCCVIQFAAMEPSPGTRPVLPELAPQKAGVLQAATRASWRAWHCAVSKSLTVR